MGLRRWLFAATYDRMSQGLERAGLRAMRAQLLAQARGDVLEVGAGTGANLGHYSSEISSLTLTEPDRTMLRRLHRATDEHPSAPTVLRAPAEDIPLDDDAVDTIVSTLVLCGVDDPERAVGEMRRVLRPGGRLLVLEHVRADDPALAARQERMNRINRFLSGCECTRRTASTLGAGGFDTAGLVADHMRAAPEHVSPLIIGAAPLVG